MTHDELLAKIDVELVTHGQRGNIVKHSFALRAVVKMHEPVSIPWDEYLEDICVPCDTDYPCPTIQAIEKELG